MTGHPRVYLTKEVVERCMRFAERLVADYQTKPSHAASVALSTRGMQFNVTGIAHGKMAECALAEYLGLSIEVLDWSDVPDDGADIELDGLRIDVKATHNGSRYLIWPLSKRHIFDKKRFDVLVMVKGDYPPFVYHDDRCMEPMTIMGFVPKHTFAARKGEWDQPTKLDRGTWYLDQDELVPIQYLREAGHALVELAGAWT